MLKLPMKQVFRIRFTFHFVSNGLWARIQGLIVTSGRNEFGMPAYSVSLCLGVGFKSSVELFRLATACLRMYSICPFTLRSSSCAHFSSSFHSCGLTRSKNFLGSTKLSYRVFLCSKRGWPLFRRREQPTGCLPWRLFVLHPTEQCFFRTPFCRGDEPCDRPRLPGYCSPWCRSAWCSDRRGPAALE